MTCTMTTKSVLILGTLKIEYHDEGFADNRYFDDRYYDKGFPITGPMMMQTTAMTSLCPDKRALWKRIL